MKEEGGESRPVVVVGGGIGGVVSALALARQGRRVALLERAHQIGAIGYGVQIGPNVFPMLQQLELGEAVLEKSYQPVELLLYEVRSGEQLGRIPLRTAAFSQRYCGAPYLAIHREDLHQLLLKACKAFPQLELNQSTTVARYVQPGENISVATDDRRSMEAAAVIVADGLRSRLRSQMHPGDVARETGYVAHRGLVPMLVAPPLAQRRKGVTMWVGPGFYVIYYPLRNRTELNIVVVVRVPMGTEPGTARYRQYLAAVANAAQIEPREVISVVDIDRYWYWKIVATENLRTAIRCWGPALSPRMSTGSTRANHEPVGQWHASPAHLNTSDDCGHPRPHRIRLARLYAAPRRRPPHGYTRRGWPCRCWRSCQGKLRCDRRDDICRSCAQPS